MSLFGTIKKLYEDKGENFDYENFVIEDRVGKNLKKISEGRYAIKNKISIIEEVKGLVGGGEYEIGKVEIDGNKFDIKFKLDSTDSEVISGNVITITRNAAPSDEAGLTGIINALYVKKDGSGGYKIGADATDAKQLNCASTLFSTTATGDCAAITTPVPTPAVKTIIEEVKGLVGGGEYEIGKVEIDSNKFDIKFKLDSTDSEVISGNVITITKNAAPSDEAGLAGIINALYVKKDGSGGYKIGTDATDAKQLNCASTLFSTTAIGDCAAITTLVPTPTPTVKTIIEEVKGLVSGGEFEIGKVEIDSNKFDIKFKLDSTDSEVISGTTITITRKAAPSDEAELAGIVNALYVKKDGSAGYKIGTDTTDAIQLNCAATLFSTTTVGDCAAITTPAPTSTPKTTVSISDAKQGLNSVFYYAKDLIINKDIARYESASDSDKKLWASETRKIMTKLKSGIDGKIPSIDKIDGYNKIYLNDALGRPKDTKTFIKNIVEKDYKGKVESNADFSKKAACAKFNLNSSECTDPKIMESIKTNVCNNNLYAEKDTNAYKLFCDASTSDIDSLSFDSKLVTELDYA